MFLFLIWHESIFLKNTIKSELLENKVINRHFIYSLQIYLLIINHSKITLQKYNKYHNNNGLQKRNLISCFVWERIYRQRIERTVIGHFCNSSITIKQIVREIVIIHYMPILRFWTGTSVSTIFRGFNVGNELASFLLTNLG